MTQAILALNAGSSSLKFGLYPLSSASETKAIVRGIADLSGVSELTIKGMGDQILLKRRFPGSELPDLMAKLLDWIGDLPNVELAAAGHRIVHGGGQFNDPVILSPERVAQIEKLTPLAPLHQPRSLAPVRAVAEAMPQLLQVGCFDTAFHRSIDPLVAAYGLPRVLYEEGIRRVGFHGLSYEYVSRSLQEIAPDIFPGRVIVAHLGNGASLCALRNGKSVDTTMGLSVLDGLVMSSRCGAIDPGVLLYLLQEKHLTVAELQDLLYSKSGLLGFSGMSGDVRVLSKSEDPRAKEALDLFAFRTAREIAALTNTLGGLDGLVFTAGIGEHSASMRSAICSHLGWLGVKLDSRLNEVHASKIGGSDSSVIVLVIPTDEEAVIADQVRAALLAQSQGK